MINEEVASKIHALTEQNTERIMQTADYIWKNPESGYREWKTHAYAAKQFEDLGYSLETMGNIPGFYVDLDSGRPGPTLAILGELDSIICAGHPDADPETGAVHACGHHTQIAYLVGAAAVLRDAGILGSLCGKIRFVAVPAEELIEIGYRCGLREQGIIKYLGGKVELLYRGVFDGVDAVAMIHSGGTGEKSLVAYKGNNGCMAKNISYLGKAAHAGGGPQKGINALYAASLGIQAINAIRETFVEENITRVHPIITEGGTAVNVIPETVRLEAYVRGSTPEAIVAENNKVNRALAGAAVSIGARLKINDIPGYMPLHNNEELNKLMYETGALMLGVDNVEINDKWHGGSTDMGDLCCVLPVVHTTVNGGMGTGHGVDYFIKNPDIACIDSTRCIAALACALLGNDAANMKKIKANFNPAFEDYAAFFEFIDKIYIDKEVVLYEDDCIKIEL